MAHEHSGSEKMDEVVQQEMARYRQRKQFFDEVLEMRREEGYRVLSIPPEEPIEKRKRHVITRYVVHRAYRRALQLIRGTGVEARLKRTRLYEALANGGVIMRLSTGDNREGRA